MCSLGRQATFIYPSHQLYTSTARARSALSERLASRRDYYVLQYRVCMVSFPLSHLSPHIEAHGLFLYDCF